MRYLVLISFAAALILPALVQAGSTANPVGTVGKENFGFTFEYEMQKKNIDNDPTTSQRGLGKVIWGVTDRVDLYAKLGASNLKVPVVGAQEFEGKRAMTWGGGGRVSIYPIECPKMGKIGTYGDVQIVSFQTKGVVFRNFTEGYTERFEDTYKWNELQLSIIVAWERSYFMPYIGFALTNIFGDVRTDVFRGSGGAEEFIQHERHEFREDAVPELVLGMDIPLSGSARVAGEIRYSEEEDISFTIGASELWHVK